MNWPNFFVVGAQKAGTSAFCEMLAQHPQVWMARRKELNYFASREQSQLCRGPGDEVANRLSVRDQDEYLQYFFGSEGHSAIGEGSVLYLYDTQAPGAIKERVPDARIIAILRNPIDRAFSAFNHLRREGREPCTRLEDGLAREPERIEKGWEMLWHYVNAGRYCMQLKRYRDHFQPEKILVLWYDDFLQDAQSTMRRSFEFLGLSDSSYATQRVVVNRGGVARVKWMQSFLSGDSRLKWLLRSSVPPRLKRFVMNHYHRLNLRSSNDFTTDARAQLLQALTPDIKELECMMQHSLQHWYQKT